MNRVGGLALAGILGIGLAGAAAQTSKQPVDYVDPNIGGIGQLLRQRFRTCSTRMAWRVWLL